MLTKFSRWLFNGLRNTVTHDGRLGLPPAWLLWIFGASMTLLVLSTVPQSAADFYHHALAKDMTPMQSFGYAAAMASLLLLVLGFMGALYLYVLSLICSILVPDLVSMVRALWRGIRQIPAALRACGRGIASGWRFLIGIPARWRAMSADDKSFARFMTVFLAIVAAVGYFLWPSAHAVHAWLPQWIRMSDSDWMGTLFIDVIMSAFAVAFIAPLLVSAVRLIRPRRRLP